MADVVTSQTLVDTTGTKTVMKFTNISDGSGETLVTKMDASALTFMTEDATKTVAKIWWSVNTTNGKSGVELLWAGSGTSAANATIGFTLSNNTKVVLEVYDVKGRKIESIIDKNLRSGDHNIAWDGMEYSSGIYFIRLSTPEIERKQKITLLK